MDSVRKSSVWSTFESLSGDGSRRSSIAEFRPDWKLYLSFGTLCVLVFGAAVDGTGLASALPTIAAFLESNTTDAIWISVSMTLSSTIFSLFFVAISIILGRKPIILLAIFLFMAGNIISSFAPNIVVMIIGRTLHGVGSGTVVMLTEILLTDLVPPIERAAWFGAASVSFVIGAACGPLIFGALASNNLWRWAFRVSIPFCIVAAVTIASCLKVPRKKRKASTWAQLAGFDWAGLILFVLSVTGLLLGISMGGLVYAWSDWRVLTPLSVGAVSTIILIIFESLYCRKPYIRLYLFGNPTVAITLLCAFFHGFILWSLMFYLPLYYQAVKNFSPTRSAVAVLLETLTIIPVSVLLGVLVSYTGRYKWSIFAGWALTICVSFFMFFDANTSPAVWVCLNIVVGFGSGVLFSGMAVSVQAVSKQLEQGSAFAVSMLHFFRLFGASTGVTVCGQVFQSEMRKSLVSLQGTLPEVASQSVQLANGAIRKILELHTLKREEQTAVVQAYADGLQKVWLTLCFVAVVGTLSCVFAKEFSLDGLIRVRKLGYKNLDSKDAEKVEIRVETVLSQQDTRVLYTS